MTIKKIIEKYDVPIVDSFLANIFKGEYIFDSRPYATTKKCNSIFEKMRDKRRGLWINKFCNSENEVVCIQLSAGKEGDEACATIITDKSWLISMAEDNETIVNISTPGSLLIVDNLDVDISKYVIDTLECFGTDNGLKTIIQDLR